MLLKTRTGAISVPLLVLLLVTTACSSGGGSSQSKQDNSMNGQANGQTSSMPNFPLVTKSTQLNYWVQMDSKVAATKKSFADLPVFPLLEKQTDIKINFIQPPLGQETEQFNLMISSGELPDMISWNWISYPGGPSKAIGDGVIIKLNDLVDKYAPHFKQFLDQNPDIKKDIVTDDGSIYSVPLVRQEKTQRYTVGFQLRQDWLDKLGLQPPKTIDDWYNVLKAFKQKDPGGTGKVLPFGNSTDLALKQFMAGWGMTFGFYQVNGQVKFGPYDPDYKTYLTTMHQWYQEGLIDPDFASTNDKQFDAKVTGNQIGAYFALLNGVMGRYLSLMQNDPNFKLVGVSPPLYNGKSYNFQNSVLTGYDGSGVAISGKSSKTVEAIKWLDVGYSEWGHNLFNFGIEGQSYNWVNGYPQYTDAVLHNPDLSPTNALSSYTIADTYGRFFNQDDRKAEQLLVYPAQKAAAAAWASASPERQMPTGVTPTLAEGTQLANMMKDVNTYTNQMFIKFIVGDEPLTNYDNYIQTLKQMKIDQAISIEQAALDRYKKR